MLLISEIEASFISKTRTKRTPDSESIQRWKLAFSGDLSTPFASSTKFPSILTCNWALHELCLKHVSCRELWVLFRRNCVVDAQNNCRMSNKFLFSCLLFIGLSLRFLVSFWISNLG
ncbi:unnamed protein product [Meloidogyne enterolobii]|uniref:Uncharacterized protein n=1 Tax=Meloidogyne enterolobii TaxID=390850 RepID=A0ACB0Y8S8_MELEN